MFTVNARRHRSTYDRGVYYDLGIAVFQLHICCELGNFTVFDKNISLKRPARHHKHHTVIAEAPGKNNN